jgi:hypothetical protein
MKLIQILVLGLSLYSALPAGAIEPKARQTFYVQIMGKHAALEKIVLKELGAQPCWELKDAVPESKVTPPPFCHAFEKFQTGKKIFGSLKDANSTFLVRISVRASGTYSVFIFSGDGSAEMPRILTAEGLKDKSKMAQVILGLTFK